MGEVITIGLDIAKSVFQVHGVDGLGAVVIRKRVSRARMLDFFAGLPRCLIGIEAWPAAHHWAREWQAIGHTVRLMPPSYVKAYLKRSKNDANDAAAICEAVTRPSMRFVAVKTKEQQAALMLHRARQLLVRQRTMLSNAIRGHLSELASCQLRAAMGPTSCLRSLARMQTAGSPWQPAAFSRFRQRNTAPSVPRSPRSARASWSGIAPVSRAGGWRRFLVSGRSWPPPLLPRSATGRRSGQDEVWPPGSGWCRSNTRPAARTSSAALRSRAIDTCGGCSSMVPWPSSAMRRSTARRSIPGWDG